jgi:hypothetical protein
VSDRLNFVLEFVLDENAPGPRVPGAVLPPGPDALADVPRAASISRRSRISSGYGSSRRACRASSS